MIVPTPQYTEALLTCRRKVHLCTFHAQICGMFQQKKNIGVLALHVLCGIIEEHRILAGQNVHLKNHYKAGTMRYQLQTSIFTKQGKHSKNLPEIQEI